MLDKRFQIDVGGIEWMKIFIKNFGEVEQTLRENSFMFSGILFEKEKNLENILNFDGKAEMLEIWYWNSFGIKIILWFIFFSFSRNFKFF